MRVEVDRGREVVGDAAQLAVRIEFEPREFGEAAVAAIALRAERASAAAGRFVFALRG